jgi:DNA-binding transcriptional regulator GbsR (MarR family)
LLPCVSARRVSEDAYLRKEFYKSAETQMSLLRTIGVTEMEKQIVKRCKPLIDRSAMLENPEDQELDQQDIKEIIHDVLNELKTRR